MSDIDKLLGTHLLAAAVDAPSHGLRNLLGLDLTLEFDTLPSNVTTKSSVSFSAFLFFWTCEDVRFVLHAGINLT